MVHNKSLVHAVVAALLMSMAAGAASHLKPSRYLSDTRGERKIADIIPHQFGQWRELPQSNAIVNPQQKVLLDSLYSEQVARTYQNAQGYRVMLSIAYGRNQNDSFQVHLPEICYPAQGFQVVNAQRTELTTEYGTIPVKQLKTTYQDTRVEPVMYWTTIGDHAVTSGTDKKLKEMEYAMKDFIADGLLFRLSSIDPNFSHATEVQQQFVRDLLSQINPADRLRLAGLRS